MRGPFEITADAIVGWCASGNAPAVFPKLIRRLVAAFVRRGQIQFRADAGSRLPGFDGIVNTPDEGTFVPLGLSVWELSVKANVSRKMEADFTERVKRPVPGIHYKDATYIGVTGRRFSGKAQWQAEKQRLGIFANVIVYDADDIARVLESAPAVVVWLADVLGMPLDGLVDVDTYLDRWSRETTPSLPTSLLLSQREAQVVAVETWLNGEDTSALRVQADTREEAAAFVSAVIAREQLWVPRTVVAETASAWRAIDARASGQSLVLLPTFEPIPAAPSAASTRAVLMLGAGERAPGGTVTLDRQDEATIVAALHEAGVTDSAARDIGRSSRGRLAVVKRMTGLPHKPAWVSSDAVLIAQLLVGAWEPNRDVDRQIVERLGASPGEVDARCTNLARASDPPIERHGNAWRWCAPKDAWQSLASQLGQLALKRFEAVAIDVLSTPNPMYTLPQQERLFAGVYGKTIPHSAALRQGIAASLAWLPVFDEELKATFNVSIGSDIATRVVRKVLTAEWPPWAAAAELLPTLAEAAPSAFLDAMDASIDRGEVGVSHLFAEEGSFSSPHTGMLWALETLGWRAELTPRVASILARLAAVDPGGRLVNRPARSLRNLLHWSLPQSATSVQERISILRSLFLRHAEVARSIAIGHLHSLQMGMMTNAARPRFREWDLPVEGTQASGVDAYTQIDATLDLAVADAGDDGSRWAALIELRRLLPDALEARVLAALDQHVATMTNASAARDALRECIHLLHMGTGTRPLDKYAALYHRFEPTDEVDRVAWLFKERPALPEKTEDWQHEARRLGELRAEALQRLLMSENRWIALRRLVEVCSDHWGIGLTIAQSGFAQDCESHLVEDGDIAWEPVLVPLTGYRLASDPSSTEATLKGLVSRDRLRAAASIAVALPPSEALWKCLEAVGGELAREYWRDVPAHRFDSTLAERGASALLAVGRPGAAAEVASHHMENVAAETALTILEALRCAPEGEVARFMRSGAASYHIERLFQRIDGDETIAPERVIGVEISFVNVLTETRRRVPKLSAALGQAPENFLHLVRMLYRAEGAPPPEGADVAPARARAEGAHNVLRGWDGTPGDHLPEDARDAFLLEWCRKVITDLDAEGRRVPAIVELGKVLARAPSSDGVWPCIAARELIDGGVAPDLATQLPSDKSNLRGVVTKALDAGGEQERAIAAALRRDAKTLQERYPRTAAMLSGMAEDYEREAEAEDASSKTMLNE